MSAGRPVRQPTMGVWQVQPVATRGMRRDGRDLVAAVMPWPDFDGSQACAHGGEEWTDLDRVTNASLDGLSGVCFGCPFLTACAEWGIAHEEYGFWGGLSPKDRVLVRRARGQVFVPVEPWSVRSLHSKVLGITAHGARRSDDGPDIDVYVDDLPWGEPEL